MYQAESSECGIACLSMISNYHGGGFGLKELREKLRAGSRGVNLSQLIKLAESIHFSSRPIKTSIDSLKKAQLPCILHWDMEHFVVLKKIKRNAFVVLDPAYGEVVLSEDEFSKHFTGIILELSPNKNFESRKKRKTISFKELLAGLQRLLPSFFQIVMLSFVMQAFLLIIPFYIQTITDNAISGSDTELILVLGIGFSVIYILQSITNLVRGGIVIFIGNLLNVELCSRLFHHLLKLPMDYFSNRHVGDTISRFESLKQIKEAISTKFTESVIDGTFSIIGLAILLSYSVPLTLIVLLSLCLSIIIRVIWFPIYQNGVYKKIQTSAKENTTFIESLRAIQTIKLFGLEDARNLLWKNAMVDTTNAAVKLEKQELYYHTGERLISGIENIVVVGLSASYVIDSAFTLGMMFAFIAYKSQFVTMFLGLLDNVFLFRSLRLHLDRLSDITDSKPEADLDCDNNFKLEGSISVKNLSFRYSADNEFLLDNINLQVNSGESVAIVGPSGRGKTTLVKILLSLIDAESGSIEIDKVPLHKVGKRNYRSQIASVMQDDQLLMGSIKDNICLFDVNQDDEWIIECARKASIHDEIMQMPMGYSTHLGEMGGTISGGQKQRLLLARALYKKPKILFLDEATSHLDIKTERNVNEAIKALQMTRIIIAHRPETIKSADRIFEL